MKRYCPILVVLLMFLITSCEEKKAVKEATAHTESQTEQKEGVQPFAAHIFS